MGCIRKVEGGEEVIKKSKKQISVYKEALEDKDGNRVGQRNKWIIFHHELITAVLFPVCSCDRLCNAQWGHFWDTMLRARMSFWGAMLGKLEPRSQVWIQSTFCLIKKKNSFYFGSRARNVNWLSRSMLILVPEFYSISSLSGTHTAGGCRVQVRMLLCRSMPSSFRQQAGTSVLTHHSEQELSEAAKPSYVLGFVVGKKGQMSEQSSLEHQPQPREGQENLSAGMGDKNLSIFPSI